MTGNVLGAAYLQALFAGDDELAKALRGAHSDADLLDALTPQLLVLGRRIATDSDRTLTEVGDALVRAAHGLASLVGGKP